MEISEKNIIKAGSRKSGQRGASGGNVELLPAMTTLSANTNNSLKEAVKNQPGLYPPKSTTN